MSSCFSIVIIYNNSKETFFLNEFIFFDTFYSLNIVTFEQEIFDDTFCIRINILSNWSTIFNFDFTCKWDTSRNRPCLFNNFYNRITLFNKLSIFIRDKEFTINFSTNTCKFISFGYITFSYNIFLLPSPLLYQYRNLIMRLNYCNSSSS